MGGIDAKTGRVPRANVVTNAAAPAFIVFIPGGLSAGSEPSYAPKNIPKAAALAAVPVKDGQAAGPDPNALKNASAHAFAKSSLDPGGFDSIEVNAAWNTGGKNGIVIVCNFVDLKMI